MRHLLLSLFLCVCGLDMLQAQPRTISEIKPLQPGDSIPDALLYNMANQSINLQRETKGKISVVIFYRGGWCPFCNAHLSDLQDIARPLKKKGVLIMALSPENVANLNKTASDNSIKFPLYCDPGSIAASKFGIAYLQGNTWSLPTPSVFIITPDGKIHFTHFDPDYKNRLSADTILAKVDELIVKTGYKIP